MPSRTLTVRPSRLMRIRYRVVTVLEAKVGVHFAFSCGDAAGIIVGIPDSVLRSALREVAHGTIPLTAEFALPFAAANSAKGAQILPGCVLYGWNICTLVRKRARSLAASLATRCLQSQCLSALRNVRDDAVTSC